MNSPEHLPEGAGLIVPSLTVRDTRKAADFYTKAFGFSISHELQGPDGKPLHVGLSFHNHSIVMLGAEGAWQNSMQSPATTGHPVSFDLYVMVPDIDAFFIRAKKVGAEVTSEPDDMFWGYRMASFKDIDSYRWSFASPIKDFDPQALKSEEAGSPPPRTVCPEALPGSR